MASLSRIHHGVTPQVRIEPGASVKALEVARATAADTFDAGRAPAPEASRRVSSQEVASASGLTNLISPKGLDFIRRSGGVGSSLFDHSELVQGLGAITVSTRAADAELRAWYDETRCPFQFFSLQARQGDHGAIQLGKHPTDEEKAAAHARADRVFTTDQVASAQVVFTTPAGTTAVPMTYVERPTALEFAYAGTGSAAPGSYVMMAGTRAFGAAVDRETLVNLAGGLPLPYSVEVSLKDGRTVTIGGTLPPDAMKTDRAAYDRSSSAPIPLHRYRPMEATRDPGELWAPWRAVEACEQGSLASASFARDVRPNLENFLLRGRSSLTSYEAGQLAQHLALANPAARPQAGSPTLNKLFMAGDRVEFIDRAHHRQSGIVIAGEGPQGARVLSVENGQFRVFTSGTDMDIVRVSSAAQQ
ncbi:MAG: hypothetical protein JNJ54_32135 [Myxococcaceae bacterium]|nr:hypothetical protein [Myxococcaceae bacterium]